MTDEAVTMTEFPQTVSHWWCGEGCWEKHSDITSKIETYNYEDEEMSYWEKAELQNTEDDEECQTS
jgi:hypothetical protein